MMPEFFADHIGNLTVELVLAAVEISTLLIRVRPNLETLAVLYRVCVKDCGLHNKNIDMIILFACLVGWLDSSFIGI